MKRVLALLPFVALWAPVCFAASPDALSVQSRTMHLSSASAVHLPPYATEWQNGSIKMPYVTSTASPSVARRINEGVYLAVLHLAPPEQPGDTFTPLAGLQRIAFSTLGFAVPRNDGRVLTIVMDGEICGANCEQYHEDINFDADTGRRLVVSDLFTRDGLAVAATRMNDLRQSRYKHQIDELHESLDEMPKETTADLVEDTHRRLAFNEKCLADVKKNPYAADDVSHFDLGLPAGRGILLITGHCASYAEIRLDDVAGTVLPLSPMDLFELLTPYGKSLLLGQAATSPPATFADQVLHGKIGAAPVTVLLSRGTPDSLSGWYYYDKERRPIGLVGKVSAADVELTEKTDANAGRMVLQAAGAALSGQWRSKGKVLPVSLAE